MQREVTRPGWLQLLIALMLPAALIAGWCALVLNLQSGDPSSQMAERGSDTERIEGSPDVVVVGNSLTFRGVDAKILARELGVEEVAVITYGGSWAPTWYAAVKNQVFAHGVKPRLVVVVNTLDNILRTDPPQGRREVELYAAMTEDEPVLADKVFHDRSMGTPLHLLRSKRGGVGERILGALKHAPLRILGVPDPDEVVDAAFAEVFERDGATDPRLNRRVIPIVEIERERSRAGTDPRASLVPDFVELTRENGAQVVFARIPVSRAGRVEYPIPPLDVERRAVAMMNELGAGYLDLHGQQYPDSSYLDDVHLNRGGQVKYTKALAESLLRLGALQDGPLATAELPPWPPEFSRTGTPPALPDATKRSKVEGCRVAVRMSGFEWVSDARLKDIGVGAVSPLRLTLDRELLPPNDRPKVDDECHPGSFHYDKAMYGWHESTARVSRRPSLSWTEDLPLLSADESAAPAWWVYPGTTLRLDFTRQEGDVDEPTTVEILALGLGPGPPATVEVDGVRGRPRHRGSRYMDRIEVDHKPRSIAFHAPRDGQFWLVRRVALVQGELVTHVIGNPEDLDTTVRLAGHGISEDPDLQTDGRVHELDAPLPEPPTGEVEQWSVVLPEYGRVSYRGLYWRSGFRKEVTEDDPRSHSAMEVIRRCSPLVLLEDGVPMTRTTLPDDFTPEAIGAYRHQGDRILFHPTGGTAVGHDYTVRLTDERLCKGHLWLYGGDDLTVSNDEMLPRLLSGANTALIGGFVFGDRRKVWAHVQVTSAAGTHLEVDVPIRRLEGEPLALRLTERLPPEPEDVRIRITTPDDGPLILLNVVALEDRIGPPRRDKKPPPEDEDEDDAPLSPG